MDFSGSIVVDKCATVTLPPGCAVKLDEHSLYEFGTEDERKGRFVSMSLVADVGGKKAVHGNEWFFAPFKDSPLADAKVSCKVEKGDGPTFKVSLSTDRPAFFVWANAKGIRGEFDDNSFTLLPFEPRTLVFTPKDSGVTLHTFEKALSVSHLRQTY